MLLDSIINEVDPSWNEFISNKEVQLELKKIENNIGNEYYPDTKNVLRFLKNNLNLPFCQLCLHFCLSKNILPQRSAKDNIFLIIL